MSEKIIFMGTPEFAVESLNQLLENGFNVCAVVTVPDKPAGRGQQVSESSVKQFAIKKGIRILQPVSLKDEFFLDELKKINADLFVVVAFRMLPEVVWSMPRLGTINLHGSLLPDYRGAAPINWAIINGEKETGATTFFIEKEIDTGKIIDSVKIAINETDNAGIVHDSLMKEGAKLLTKTVQSIFSETATGIEQKNKPQGRELKKAPKIFKNDCKINWRNSTTNIYNKIRGLSPYPGAWTEIEKDGQKKSLKIYQSKKRFDGLSHVNELIIQDNCLLFGCEDGWIEIEELQLEGKKRMLTGEFLKGFNPLNWKPVN